MGEYSFTETFSKVPYVDYNEVRCRNKKKPDHNTIRNFTNQRFSGR